MRQRWHYIIGSLRDGKLHVRHKRSLFFNSQWYNLSYSDIAGSYIKAGAVPRPLSKPFILQMWRLRKTAQGHSEKASLWLAQHRLELSALWGESEKGYLFYSTWVLKSSGETLSHHGPCCEEASFELRANTMCECCPVLCSVCDSSKTLIPLSFDSLVHKVRLISP